MLSYWTVVINSNIEKHNDSAYAQVRLCFVLYRLTLVLPVPELFVTELE
jgi:hypothetical protein